MSTILNSELDWFGIDQLSFLKKIIKNMNKKDKNIEEIKKIISNYNRNLTNDEVGVMAVKISEMVEPPLTAQEQSFFIAGFCECVKWLGSNDR